MNTATDLSTKEQVLRHIVSSGYRMTKQDSSFFTHVQHLLATKKQVTSNQARLFDKLVLKLGKQIRAKGYDPRKLIELPWRANLIESTQATLRLVDDTLIMETPFNKKFIDDFNGARVQQVFAWDRLAKTHKAPFSTKALKLATTKMDAHFAPVKYCDEIAEILATYVTPFLGDLIWDPTLVKSNDKYYIAASNRILNERLTGIELNPDPRTLYNLSKLGIEIHPSVIGDDPFLKFASTVNVEVDSEKLEQAASWLAQLGINTALISREIMRWADTGIYAELVEHLSNNRIGCEKDVSFRTPITEDFAYITATRVHRIDEDSKQYSKCILIKNSRPVKVW